MQPQIICILTKRCCRYTSSIYSSLISSTLQLRIFIYNIHEYIPPLSHKSKPHTRKQKGTLGKLIISLPWETHMPPIVYIYTVYENFSEENTQKRYSICCKQSARKAFTTLIKLMNACIQQIGTFPHETVEDVNSSCSR